MDVGSIPLSEIKAYLDLYRIDNFDEQMRYLRFIRVLDNHYLKVIAEDRERKLKQANRHGNLHRSPRNRG